MKVVFFGTPLFAAKVLDYLLENGVNVVAVITKPDRPQGRSSTLIPTPVKCLAEQRHIPVMQPEVVSAPEHTPLLQAFNADLFVVVAYGEIIKQHLLDMPKIGCINLHASLLPSYRGAAPIQRSLINGEKETGVTIIHMARKMDAGDIISMEKVEIGIDMTFPQLEADLCEVGAKLLLSTIKALETDTASRIQQDHTLATYAPKIELEDCEIDWNKSALEIHNLVRGTSPHPGAWCKVVVKGENKRLKVISAKLSSEDSDRKPGEMIPSNALLITCGQGVIQLTQVQLEGKKAMTAEEFLRGLPSNALQFS